MSAPDTYDTHTLSDQTIRTPVEPNFSLVTVVNVNCSTDIVATWILTLTTLTGSILPFWILALTEKGGYVPGVHLYDPTLPLCMNQTRLRSIPPTPRPSPGADMRNALPDVPLVGGGGDLST